MTFQNVSIAKFQALKGHLVSGGAVVSGGNVGTITGHGVTAGYEFQDGAGVLSVSVIHKPFFIPESAIESQISDALETL